MRKAQGIGSVGILSLVLVLSGCQRLGLRTYRQSSEAMEPTMRPGQTFLASTSYYTYHPIRDGDLLVYRRGDDVVVKRVLALPGETIEGRQGVMVRNGQEVHEPYLAPTEAQEVDTLASFPTERINEGEVFVSGDNRAQSLDSRSPEYGPVLIKDVIGKVMTQTK